MPYIYGGSARGGGFADGREGSARRGGLACREASVMPWRIGSPQKLPATAKVQLAADVVTVAKVQLAAEVATTAKVQLAAACRGGSARS